MGDKLANVVFPLVFICLVVGMLIGFTYAEIYKRQWAEISTEEYVEVEELSINPDIQKVATEAIWNDGIINRSEYKAITGMKVTLKNKKIMQKITREDE